MEDTNRDRRDQARWIILLATLAGAMYLCWLMLKPFVGVLLWAAVLTMSFEPIHRRILERTKSPNLSALWRALFVVLAIGVPAGLLTWAIIHELTPALSRRQTGLTELLSPHSPITGPVIAWLGEHVDIEKSARRSPSSWAVSAPSSPAARSASSAAWSARSFRASSSCS